jgi:MoxR-like ATPase
VDLLIEGVPGRETLTIKTVAEAMVSSSPDPSSDSARGCTARQDEFGIELGPVFCNFLLADASTARPPRCNGAEVMQGQTIGARRTLPCHSSPANPIESEGVSAPRGPGRPLHAQVLVDYPGRLTS